MLCICSKILLFSDPCSKNCIASCILWDKEVVGIGSTFVYLDDKAL